MLNLRQRSAAAAAILFPKTFFALHVTKPYAKSELVHFMLTIIRDPEALSTATARLEKAVLRRWSKAMVSHVAKK